MSIFDQVEKESDGALGTRTSWRGILSIKSDYLGLEAEYHLRGGKAKGDQEKVEKKLIDSETGREVVRKDVVRLYKYKENGQTREGWAVIPYSEAKERVHYIDADGVQWLVSGRKERVPFDRASLEEKGIFTEIPEIRVKSTQDGEEIENFERTTRLEIDNEHVIPLSRVPEYLFKTLYMLDTDHDKKVKESPQRVRNMARKLLEKNSALVCFFSWGRSTEYFTSVIFPYEDKKTGTLWLLMGQSEGKLTLDTGFSLQDQAVEEFKEPVQVATTARKPRVKISI